MIVLKQRIDEAYRQDEAECIKHLLKNIQFTQNQFSEIEYLATKLVKGVRARAQHSGGIDQLMQRYDLSSEQGVALMCLAEALLRIPDKETIDELIKDKLFSADWENELNKGGSLFVNAATWGLMLTGKLFRSSQEKTIGAALKQWLQKAGEPVVRTAVSEAVKILGKQFVLGETIEQALQRAKEGRKKGGYRFSFDMLGEAARTHDDALHYFEAYRYAIERIGQVSAGSDPVEKDGISVKLSALHPRYEVAKRAIMLPVIIDRVTQLARLAKKHDIGLTIDAEEASRLDLSLEIFEAVFKDSALEGWEGLGLALQAYQKRAFYIIDWLAALAKAQNKKIMLRLVKGAYWDYEIKDSQVKGLEGYPVFTRKVNTDVSYLACAQKIIAYQGSFYPQFATHNAQTVAAIIILMGHHNKGFEFQRLKGMGRTLYNEITGKDHYNIPCRIYAPVGQHRDLLAYLVRRLLENGANTSFVNRIVNIKAPISDLVADPVLTLRTLKSIPHPKIPLPEAIYPSRKNSRGLDLSSHAVLSHLTKALQEFQHTTWQAELGQGEIIKVTNPANREEVVGQVVEATELDAEKAVERASKVVESWDQTPIAMRAQKLEKMADLLEEHRFELMALIIREGGRTIPDALSEVREAIDFCRYYAVMARESLTSKMLPGPTGEYNALQMHGRGITVCISPWNFPLAIFTGQIAAALVAGNPVIAKPALQTPLTAARAVELFHIAGIPTEVLQCVPGAGKTIGAKLVADIRVRCAMLTGSIATARFINQTLANREGPIVPFIAETGGQNAMIADSTALPEQLVEDIVVSAFGSAGQRCSALRVLFIQEDIAQRIIEMLRGALATMVVGDPSLLSTDVGPVIDDVAYRLLQQHIDYLDNVGQLIYRIALSPSTQQGSFFAPCIYEIDSLTRLNREVFGPILHVIRFKRHQLDKVITEINGTGFGLTFGIHTRITSLAQAIQAKVHAGNVYVNRNMIGAVVGVQPFGGEGLSGTGPKAGGPHYLMRLCHERTFSINATAAGGNASLLTLEN